MLDILNFINRLKVEFFFIPTVGITIFLLSYFIGKFILNKTTLEPRLNSFRQYVYDLQGGITDVNSLNLVLTPQRIRKQQQLNSKKREKYGLAKWVETFIRNFSIVGGEKIKQLFDQAGLISKDAKLIFYASKTFLLILFVGIYLALMNIIYFFDYIPTITKIFFLLLMAYIGWVSFDLYIKSAIKKRVKVIEKQFPEVMDLMIICVQAGLSLSKSITHVANEVAYYSPEISQELLITGIELDLMLNQRKALINFTIRVPSQVIRIFSMTLIQSIQQGTPLIQALDILASEIRTTSMQKAENKAAKLPTLLVLPLVLFILPNIFIVLLGPAIVQLIKAFK